MTARAGPPVAEIDRLSASTAAGTLLHEVSFDLTAGRVTALVGPSGSGKTTAALALLGERGPNIRLTGRVRVGGELVVADGADPRELAAARRRVRGAVVGFLPQHVDQALNPARRVGSALDEVARTHHPGAGRQLRRRLVAEALNTAHLEVDPGLLRRFPHEFSGGQRQRLVLAQVLLCAPAVLVLDEPTTGLDPATTDQVVRDLGDLAATGPAILLLSHDLDVVRALAHDMVVLRSGRVRHRGPVEPAKPRAVLGATPPGSRANSSALAGAVLVAESVTASHRRHGRGSPVLHRVDLRIGAGECVGLVGRSGSGKTTLARCLAGLHQPDSGRVLLTGVPMPPLRRRDPRQRRSIQYVWQDVLGSFDARQPVLNQVARTAVRLRDRTVAGARAEAGDCLERLGVPADTAGRRPGELSGGELRRAALARALLARPRVLICDEITSSLDAERAASILELLSDLRHTYGMALLLISHDWSVVAGLAGRVTLLERGTVAAVGTPSELAAGSRSAVAGQVADELGGAAAARAGCAQDV
jgi:peptide/nickel transport system ATP-binding protein